MIKGHTKFGVGTSSQVAYVPNLAKHLFHSGINASISILEWKLHRWSILKTHGTIHPRWPHPKYKTIIQSCALITFEAAICHFDILRKYTIIHEYGNY